jgi:hypothetical protein
MPSVSLLDCAGRRRSPATFPGFHQGRPPRNKGLQYPPDPPTVEEIIAVMRVAGETPDGLRLRGMVVVLCRAGLRVGEALAGGVLDSAAGAEGEAVAGVIRSEERQGAPGLPVTRVRACYLVSLKNADSVDLSANVTVAR